MKPFFTKAISEFDSSITIRKDELNHFYKHWHYHDEYEMVYVIKSTGLQFVGDNIRRFSPNELTLLGSKLPHNWLNDDEYFKEEKKMLASAYIVHFQKDFVENDFFKLPLMQPVYKLFRESSHGVLFKNVTKKSVQIFERLLTVEGMEKVILVFELFQELLKENEQELLASQGFVNALANNRNERLHVVYEYIANNFTHDISLDKVAELTHMTPQSFCNYFKRKTSKTVFEYIHQMRIGYARKLLIMNEMSISEIAFKSGFNNVSFFNRQFKKYTGSTPMHFRKMYDGLG